MTVWVLPLIPATLFLAAWFVLLFMATQEDRVAAAYNKVLSNRLAIEKLREKDKKKQVSLAGYKGLAHTVMKLFLGGDSHKEINKLEEKNARIQGGDLSSVSILILPGYVVQRILPSVGYSEKYKDLLHQCDELYGKKHAENRARHTLAILLSFPLLGVGAALCFGSLLLSSGQGTVGGVVMGVGVALVLVLCYASVDEVGSQVTKRRENIARQFPNVVSKLALLVSSGMIVPEAWRQTSESQDGELYREMRKTAEELTQNIAPETAYINFINRCNTKETAKLASAIVQNLSKGNAEIGILLQALAKESWQERRHSAKRNAEKANSKLMIPTMLLFLAILIIIMVPIAMSFGSI